MKQSIENEPIKEAVVKRARRAKNKRHQADETEKLVKTIIEALQDKKGKNIVSINISSIEGTICDYFIVCHGDSTTQVDALANSVEKMVKEVMGEKPRHVEGMENSMWVLLDYADVVVHVFLNEQRDFYKLEDLWADGIFTKYNAE